MNGILLDVALASPPFIVGMILTWRVIWPRWKVYGKSLAYIAGVSALSFLLGHWSVLIGWAHQSIGLGFHLWFCRRHGFTWYAIEDPDRYVALSKQWAGVEQDEASTPGESP